MEGMITLPCKRLLPQHNDTGLKSVELFGPPKRRKTNPMKMTPNEFYENRREAYEVSPLVCFEASNNNTPINKRESTESKEKEK